jgi:hypothetical protein
MGIDQRIVGACSQCGECCHFSYWVYGAHEADFDYWRRYAGRYFEDFDFRPGIQVNPTTFISLIVVPSIPCLHFDPECTGCKLHGKPTKPKDCNVFPHNFPAALFEKIRFKSCGYTVEKKS